MEKKKQKGKVKFIRVRGKVVPIRAKKPKKSGSSRKNVSDAGMLLGIGAVTRQDKTIKELAQIPKLRKFKVLNKRMFRNRDLLKATSTPLKRGLSRLASRGPFTLIGSALAGSIGAQIIHNRLTNRKKKK